MHTRINAIKFYFEKVQGQPQLMLDFPRTKRPQLLPKVIHLQDIVSMIQQTQNIKHKTMLMLIYGMGLRVSEITKLKITDVYSKICKYIYAEPKVKKI